MGSAGGYALAMREPQDIQSELAPVGTLAARMQEGDVMLLDSWQSQGWREPGGASTGTERAFAASARMSPGDKL
jgi:hypothetical protein